MDSDIVDVKHEVDYDQTSVTNFVSTNIISHDSVVICGKCEKQMLYQEYDSQHRQTHYGLCWIVDVEDEIDFSDASKIQEILKKTTNKSKTKSKFICEWCDTVKLTISGFSNHITKCKQNPVKVLSVNNEILNESCVNQSTSSTTHNNDSMVSCGRCGESMIYEEYINKHRHTHYNLCWLEGEEKLDYLNEKKIVVLLREFLPNSVVKKKFMCEWCKDLKKSVLGFASHVKKCAIEQKLALPPPNETDLLQPKDEEINIKNNSMVICGRCNKSMTYKEYEDTHSATHNNLCWIIGDEKPDFDDENAIQYLLRLKLPKNAARQKKVKFVCEWCQNEKKSVVGFASHVKRCTSRPDKLGLLNQNDNGNDINKKSDIEITKERDDSMVTCGRCKKEMTFIEYRTHHYSKHFNLCWIDGEEILDLENYDAILNKLKQFIPFSAVRKRSVKLCCEDCKTVKKSISGFASHVIFCNKTPNDIDQFLTRCEDCGNKVKPSSLITHKMKSCKGMNYIENDNDITMNNKSKKYFKMRRKKRPPNVLSFHPDTKYITEYYDFMCRLCNFVTISVNDMIDHIMKIHDIVLNKKKDSLDHYTKNTYEVHRNIYLKPLLNYYNFFTKTFWKDVCHKDFNPDVLLLTNDEALKYIPSIQQSCKIFTSNDEQIHVDLFKSVYVNGMHWLFTGGPNWAMSWCPVPKEVQTQYLAISCHPKPDLEHKEMEIYEYPSLVQLWRFDSLTNVISESASTTPHMSYGVAHDYGAVWDMAWCPSGAYEPPQKMGLLALSTSCGDCPVFAMPFVDDILEMFYIYKAKHIVARNFECEWIDGGVQCTKVCWQAVSPFKTLICGYSNGVVSVFHINFKSIFLDNDILYPSHTFIASRSSITGLSMNYFNTTILATSATDGNVTLWDLKSTENPIFQKRSYCPSDCTWLQQCYTLVYCSKVVNPVFSKVRTINFSNCDNDVEGYNPELYVLKSVTNRNKILGDCDILKNDKKINCDEADENKTLNESNMSSDDESYKSDNSSTYCDQDNAGKSGDLQKNIDEEDFYGPTFSQKSTHWSVSTSNWMNVIATGNENGTIYEKVFLSETNNIRKGNSTTLQLMVRPLLPNDNPQEYSDGYRFKETIKTFGLESKLFLFNENAPNDPDASKPLLRYPLDNITKLSWNQNFNSFRWLAIGTQSGFTLISPSRAIPDSCIDSFYKTIFTPIDNIHDTTDISL
ncbi:PREDICTED: uncharacterized protein LOC107163755 isoform X2 [Diuraphis noxia]|uniref:uncharacterized protein LOC107163755 isoform X2 n=1 Tax=Diuraphis noxia TaxID=143948 RepID=UPI0007639074|nr:PREDICTED: uncharacterized protein LOC107163755 isoform X2 [Diuraphis noxia]